MRKKGFARAIALVLTFAPGVAAAAQPVCLTHAEATSLLTYALPQAINGTAARCAQVLPANAFLRRHGGELAARYAGQKDKYWPQAKPAFLKTLGPDGDVSANTVRNLPDDRMRQIVDIFVEGLVSQQIALKSCNKLDLAIDLLSPLPPENTAGLIALTMEVASNAEPKMGKFALCKD
ncbi:hypothetical protein [Novosphingobium mangrovi (ex Huang et al. 2023)]|uniref:Secreted protein n=1 Tax=Novosphingobium mangrovi (ex Huang et al. 2023) TaxID=2976432 RepID=A0ABT2I465_9SPHN|nr:hypothetical protein [Novosphingobium mangrovi (ex Huang et al. 2023)]MCT2399580.1 hypothetical protein [Novosphingobium mangrovi (ex Huang et al. 2023)]